MRTNFIPPKSGVSLKPRYYQTVLEQNPAVGWFEVHPENYMGSGGPPHQYLSAIRKQYPLSLHGVGMSLGSAEGIDEQHLQALAGLVNRYQPGLVSEHLAWSHFNKGFLNDLLPLPYNEESLAVVAKNIIQVQEGLGRTILVENPSSYLEFRNNTYNEPDFLNQLGRRTDCGLLLDVNNIYVSACNQNFDPYQYLKSVPWDRVGEIHLAGHSVQQIDGVPIRIDDHGSTVKRAVWDLHRQALWHLGRPLPVMIEWDTDIPEFEILLAEARKADLIANEYRPQALGATA